MSHTPSHNFSFLADNDPRLVVTAARAERALSFGDSVGALVHIRTFGEFLAKGAVTEFGGRLEEGQDQVERLRIIHRHVADERVMAMFHAIRRTGNDATHDGRGTQNHALQHLKIARELKWLDRIAKALKADVVVDREALDRGKFATDGGYQRIHKVFDGKLDLLLGDQREAGWDG